MSYFTQNSLIGLAVIAIIFFNLRMQNGRFQLDQKIFIAILIMNAMLLTLEMFLNIVTGHPSDSARIALFVIVVMFYILNPFPEALWVLYLVTIIYKEKKPSKGVLLAISLPVLLNIIFSLINLFWSFTFTIDEKNIYSRGEYFILLPMICYSYIFYYLFIVLSKRKQILRSDFQSLFFSAVPTIIAGIIQTCFYGVSLVWVALSLSMLILYMRMQSEQIYTDHLTGLSNRRMFDLQLEIISSSERKKQQVGGILIDVNRFKQVNDQYGHDVGDKVLEAIGMILRKSVRKEDFIARLGGDEFVIMIETDRYDFLEEIVLKIQENVDKFNQKSDYPFDLSLSMGYDLYDCKKNIQIKDFIKHIDQKMYDAKKQYKNSLVSVHSS